MFQIFSFILQIFTRIDFSRNNLALKIVPCNITLKIGQITDVSCNSEALHLKYKLVEQALLDESGIACNVGIQVRFFKPFRSPRLA